MNTKTIIVPNISCGHCTNTIEMEVSELAGVTSVNAVADTKQVTIDWDSPATWDEINETLHEIGYPPQQLIQLS